jgi:hypothetical protein
LSLRGTISELAIIRSTQFVSDGDSTDDGWIVLLEQGDDITQIKEVSKDGLSTITYLTLTMLKLLWMVIFQDMKIFSTTTTFDFRDSML